MAEVLEYFGPLEHAQGGRGAQRLVRRLPLPIGAQEKDLVRIRGGEPKVEVWAHGVQELYVSRSYGRSIREPELVQKKKMGIGRTGALVPLK